MLASFTPFEFERTTPESVGVDSAAIAEFQRICREKNMPHQGYLIYKDGKLCASGIAEPYRITDKRHVYSVSKTFTSTAIGLAVDEGLLSVEDTVISFFPEYCPESMSAELASMKVKHLLTMTTGHDKCALGAMMKSGKPWAEAFLEFPITFKPGERFVYSTAATYMLSAILTKITGMRMLDYMTPRFFNPLGIEGIIWSEDPEGINYGGIGIHVSPMDMLKIGVLYLNKGVWNGKRILSEAWIDEATSAIADNGMSPDVDWAQGYGYQIWRCQHNSFRADGAFGQYILVSPDKNCVTVLISEICGVLGGSMQDTLSLYWDTIYKSMVIGTLPENTQHDISVKPYFTAPDGSSDVKERHLKLAANSHHLSELHILPCDDGIALTIKAADKYMSSIICKYGELKRNKLTHCPIRPMAGLLDNGEIGIPGEVAAGYAYSDGILNIALFFVTSPHGMTLSIHDDKVIITPTADTAPIEIQLI